MGMEGKVWQQNVCGRDSELLFLAVSSSWPCGWVWRGRVGNRMKTAECFLNKFQGHSVVFILLPIIQSFFPAVSMTNAGRESTALALEP